MYMAVRKGLFYPKYEMSSMTVPSMTTQSMTMYSQTNHIVMQGLVCDDGCSNGQAYWKRVSNGTCSKTCGGGTQQVDYQCMGTYKNGKEAACIDPNFATICGTDPSGLQQCNMQPCVTYSWTVSDWSSCSKICDGGLQSRNVTCSSSTGTASPHNLMRPYTSKAECECRNI